MLVNERETLQSQIEWSQMRLDRRRKELLEWGVLLHQGRGGQQRLQARSFPGSQQRPEVHDMVEKFLLSSIQHLRARLGAVEKLIDAIAPEAEWLPGSGEQSMFALLRAAG
jgi:hypothetical protein